MNKAQILFVGEFEKAFLKYFTSDTWEIKHKANAEEAIDLLERDKITLIVARDKIERLNGYQLCLLIKSNPETRNLPFYILGDKKLRGQAIIGSVLARPNRIAEYGEVINKPQSLAKLFKEDLKDFGKNVGSDHKPITLLPVAHASGIDCDITNKVNCELLLEITVSTSMMRLMHWPKSKSQYLNECFAALNDIVNADLLGIAVSNMDKSWLAFSSRKNLNQKAFDHLLKDVNEEFAPTQDMNLMSSPPLIEKGGANISETISLSIDGNGVAAGKLIIAKYDNQKFSPVERVTISYIERYLKPVFEFLFAEQVVEKVLSREAVRTAIDSLTGLYNLEFLIGFLQQQLLFSFRNKLPVSMLMIDVDSFSQINSALGQAPADTILVKLAEKLLSVIRGSDLLARYSGDKFVIVLPNTALKGARVLAEKIRLEIEQTNFFAGRQPGPSITVSIGVAEYDAHDLNPEAILKEAKLALQKAKEAGRNKVAL